MGAAAMLCGVTRASVSVLVIMLELTDSFLYIPTYMLVVLLANGVAALFTEGIYESHIWIKGYPYLQEEIDVTYTERCCDIMVTQLTTIDLAKGPTIRDLNAMLERKNFRGFPVVTDGHFIGYVRREPLVQCLDSMLEKLPTDEAFVTFNDLKEIINQTVMRMVPDAALTQVHRVFKELEVQHVFLVGCKTDENGLVQNNMLHGVLSRKNFISYLASGKIGNPAGAHLFGSRGLTEHSRERMEQKEAEVKKSQLRESGVLL
jgi:CBS domain-containing protein